MLFCLWLLQMVRGGLHVGGLRRKHWSVLTEPDSRKDGSLWCAGGDSGVLDMVFERRLFGVFELSLGCWVVVWPPMLPWSVGYVWVVGEGRGAYVDVDANVCVLVVEPCCMGLLTYGLWGCE